jgi:hypothetical protein
MRAAELVCLSIQRSPTIRRFRLSKHLLNVPPVLDDVRPLRACGINRSNDQCSRLAGNVDVMLITRCYAGLLSLGTRDAPRGRKGTYCENQDRICLQHADLFNLGSCKFRSCWRANAKRWLANSVKA